MKIVKILFVVMCSMIIACTVSEFDDGVNEPTPTPINTDGWAEMPAKLKVFRFGSIAITISCHQTTICATTHSASTEQSIVLCG